MKPLYIAVFVLICKFLTAQQPVKRITTGTASIGLSAISVNTIVAKTYNFAYPLYNYGADSLSGRFFFSTRQKTDAGTQYTSKGFIGAFDMAADSADWLFESNYYELNQWGGALYFSNDVRTTRYNKLHGFEELKQPRLLYAMPQLNKGFLYNDAESETVNCVSLSDGAVHWSANIPRNENWVDVKPWQDSLLLVAAGGLYAIEPCSGLRWHYPLITSVKVTQPLTHSLANNNPAIRKVSKSIKTSAGENSVTELSSNILAGNGTVYFASKEKIIAVAADGRLLWETALDSFPVSKMYLDKRGDALVLINFGLARYADSYVIYGKPFVLNIDAQSGKIKSQCDLSPIENLVDFTIRREALIFAGKNAVLRVQEGKDKVDTLMMLDVPKYGSFGEFIDGSRYYLEKEGFYVALNFINDNLIYFKADNNKIYGMDKNTLTYECHFNEIYRLEKKTADKLILASENKSLIVSSNFDLLFVFNLADKPVVMGNRIYFVGDQQIQSVNMKELK